MATSVSAEDDPLVGTTLCGKWTVLRLLGVGGTALVYEARHRNGRLVALKVLRPELARRAEARARFLREGYLTNRVAHPGALAVLDDDVDADGRPFLVTELLRGDTLERRWKGAGRRLDAADALRVADRLLAVLGAAHAAGVVHRDVKPGNVFLADDGAVTLLDFGLAREGLSAATTRSDATLGTPAFMAPEQARGHWDEVDARSDLWSVGATLYALLGGDYVHARASGNATMVAAATQRAPSLGQARPDLPAALVGAVDRALAFDKAERFADAAAMRRALREAAAALPEAGAGNALPPARPAPTEGWSKGLASSPTQPETIDAVAASALPPPPGPSARPGALAPGPWRPGAAKAAGHARRGPRAVRRAAAALSLLTLVAGATFAVLRRAPRPPASAAATPAPPGVCGGRCGATAARPAPEAPPLACAPVGAAVPEPAGARDDVLQLIVVWPDGSLTRYALGSARPTDDRGEAPRRPVVREHGQGP